MERLIRSFGMRFWASALILAASVASAHNRVASAATLPTLMQWTDPTEHAFTVNVPQGWRVIGGTRRSSPRDVRNYVAAESPDDKIKVWFDDPSILPRQVPKILYQPTRWSEGKVVQTPGGPVTIESFKSGSQFAQEFTVHQVCKAAQRLSGFDMRDATQRINQSIQAAAARAHLQVQASAGDFTYRCGDRSGYTYAVTVLSYPEPKDPHTWAVYKLAGYLADRSRLDLARYVMNAMISSFKLDPAWQLQHDLQIKDKAGALMEISNLITNESVKRARVALQQSMRQVQQPHDDSYRLGQQKTSSFQPRQQGEVRGCDDLGRCATVSNEYQYYWTDSSGKVVPGPSDGSPPGPHYHRWTRD